MLGFHAWGEYQNVCTHYSRVIPLGSFGDGARDPRKIARKKLPLFEGLLPDGLSEAYRVAPNSDHRALTNNIYIWLQFSITVFDDSKETLQALRSDFLFIFLSISFV